MFSTSLTKLFTVNKNKKPSASFQKDLIPSNLKNQEKKSLQQQAFK